MRETPIETKRPAPGEPVIAMINWDGLRALYIKEVRRFFKVQLQTIWGPAFSALLLLVVFSIAFGRNGNMVMGVSFAHFAAPGLIAMAMMQNAFANSSFSLLVGKIQGNITDYLMPPISAGELLSALIGAAVTRAVLVGLALLLVINIWPGGVLPRVPLAAIYFGLMGAALLSFIGVLTSIWAEKFDHNATITNFVVQPLSLLSGTFYSIDGLHGAFRTFSHLNPFFYVISGFRYGFLGVSDSNVLVGAAVLFGVNLALGILCYAVLRSGWKLKN
ncbi:ABC transporter permease [uncultured Sphingomonas sp.]|uniref:ABC transporter permease n=1 Tax=uncultured Sphingomonas sp. TaxID=158754 RepID=UPI0025EE41E4|nr:ABC transporter permease [uncultured Sphingomonas sp.]